MWDVNNGKVLNKWSKSDGIYSSVLSDSSTETLIGTSSNTVEIFDVNTKALLETLRGHTNSVTSISVSPDGKKLLLVPMIERLKYGIEPVVKS